MIEISAQLKNGIPYPLPMDADKLRNYKDNQVVRMRISGVQKPGSVIQMNLYWACCNEVARNMEHKQWDTKNKVDFQCRVEAHLVDPDLIVVKPDGSVHHSYLSIAFKNLPHIMRCKYFDQAFEIMGSVLKCTPEKLIEMAQSHMGEKD